MSVHLLAQTTFSSLEELHNHFALTSPAFSALSTMRLVPKPNQALYQVEFYQICLQEQAPHLWLNFYQPQQIVLGASHGGDSIRSLSLTPQAYLHLIEGYQQINELPFFQEYTPPLKIPPSYQESLLSLWGQLEYALQQPNKTLPQIAHTRLEPLLAEILACYLQVQLEVKAQLTDQGLVKRFQYLVQHHFQAVRAGLKQGPITVRECADQLEVEARVLSTQIREETGETAVTQINRIWLEQAQLLLLKTTLKIKVIAAYLGFKDPAYFTRLFTNLVGVPPKRFRIQGNQASP